MARLTFSCAPSRAPSRALSAHQQHLSLSCSFMLFHALSCRAHARWQHITPRSTRLRQPQFGSQFHQYAPNLVRCLLVYRGLMLLQQVVAKKSNIANFVFGLRSTPCFTRRLHPSASPVGFAPPTSHCQLHDASVWLCRTRAGHPAHRLKQRTNLKWLR